MANYFVENNSFWSVKAHSTAISIMEMSYQGDKLATASEKVLFKGIPSILIFLREQL